MFSQNSPCVSSSIKRCWSNSPRTCWVRHTHTHTHALIFFKQVPQCCSSFLSSDGHGHTKLEVRHPAQLDHQGAQVWRVEWDMTGTTLATAADDGCIRLWKGYPTKNVMHVCMLREFYKSSHALPASMKIACCNAHYMHVWCMFDACLMHVWCMLDACLMHVWYMFHVTCIDLGHACHKQVMLGACQEHACYCRELHACNMHVSCMLAAR